MKKNYANMLKAIFVFTISLMLSTNGHAQKQEAKAKVFSAKYFDKSVPLRDVSPMLPDGNHRKIRNGKMHNNFKRREYFNAKNAFPKNGDPIVQKSRAKHNSAEPIINIDGVRLTDNSSIFAPPDTDGDVGQNYYFQMINVMFEIFDKEGNSVYGPYDNKMLWEGFVGDWTGTNDGDPIVLYDENADRWIATQFAYPHGPYTAPFYELIAISETSDPLGSWYRYAFEFSSFPDYPKFGIWNDGYYMSLNSSGDDAVVFERDSMLVGAEGARMVTFKTPGMTGSGFKSALPACSQGNFPAEGTPNYFMYFNDDGWGTGEDKIMMWEFNVDWATPANSTMTLKNNLPVEPFDSEFTPYWDDIAQPGTSQKLDAIPGAIMFSLNYRNFGNYQAIVANHTVDVDATNHAGIRWYELRNMNDGAGWQIYQQSTFAPDEHSRFMGSVSMDGAGNIALGYSVSSATIYPSIRYTGRLSGDPLNEMTFAETEALTGQYAQTSGNRWGDYSMMSIDPSDDATFWYTQEFMEQSNKWATQITSFQLQIPVTSFISYKLENQFGNTGFDADLNEVYVTLEYGTDPSNLIATFLLPEGSVAKIDGETQISGVTSNNFTNPVLYTITSGDTLSKDWTVIVTEQIPEKNITYYSIPNETRNAIIDKDSHTVDVGMPFGADLTELVASFSLSPGASASVDGFEQVSNTTANDFTNPVIYLVKALDNTTQEWEVSVSLSSGLCEAVSEECDEYISRVEIGTIDNASACEGYSDFSHLSTTVEKGVTYEITVTNGNSYANDACGIWVDWNNDRTFSGDELATISGSPGHGPYTATLTPPMDAFEGEVYMRVRITWNITPQPCGSSSYGEVEDYKLFVINGELNTEAEITSFVFEASNNETLTEDVQGQIEGSNINVNVPSITDMTNLISSFIISDGATIKVNDVDQVSGVTANNFNDSVIYTVISEDELTAKQWVVKVDNGVFIYSSELQNISIYPNPANKKLYINGLDESTITIFNLLGEIVKYESRSFGNRTLDISGINNGTYIIQIISNGNILNHKISILH
ncbi:MAG: T9SS type A sorting domain-containing protein [Salinivirgaceae bacterium]|nr:T9SS type A sorting domain-containing protein [Salinivirgaceae bacterium]